MQLIRHQHSRSRVSSANTPQPAGSLPRQLAGRRCSRRYASSAQPVVNAQAQQYAAVADEPQQPQQQQFPVVLQTLKEQVMCTMAFRTFVQCVHRKVGVFFVQHANDTV